MNMILYRWLDEVLAKYWQVNGFNNMAWLTGSGPKYDYSENFTKLTEGMIVILYVFGPIFSHMQGTLMDV